MIYFKKSLGQNFLNDLNIIKKIISLTNIENKNVIEIGPGKGALSFQILKKKDHLFLLKKIMTYQKNLRKSLKTKNINVYNDDIMNFDIEKCKKNSIVFEISHIIFHLKY